MSQSQLRLSFVAALALWVTVLLLLGTTSAAARPHHRDGDPSIVQTKSGTVRGLVYPEYRVFKGIPYAEAPVGELRFRQTGEISWDGVLNATEYGPGCPQNCILPPLTCPEAESEDCLFINVFTPPYKEGARYPVMVWIHGGHFDQGLGGCDLYDASNLVKKENAVIVTFNYRLGVLGWMAGVLGMNGNYGFFDQLNALRWVQKNIAAFNGDPNMVTLAGQSAGGTSLITHMVSKYSENLFQRAIILSAPLGLPMRTLEDAGLLGKLVMENLTCTTMDCLRSKTPEEIVAAQVYAAGAITFSALKKPIQFFYPWTPTVDYDVLDDQAIFRFWRGDYRKMPILIGSVTEEAHLFLYRASKDPVGKMAFKIALGLIMGTEVSKVIAKYPPVDGPDQRTHMGVIGTDFLFNCIHRHTYREWMKYDHPLYAFLFEHILSFDAWGPEYPYCVGHVCHGSELVFVFNPPTLRKHHNITADEERLMDEMTSYLLNFVTSGNPNVGLSVPHQWPDMDPTIPTLHFTTDKSTTIINPRGEYCDFWDEIGHRHGW